MLQGGHVVLFVLRRERGDEVGHGGGGRSFHLSRCVANAMRLPQLPQLGQEDRGASYQASTTTVLPACVLVLQQDVVGGKTSEAGFGYQEAALERMHFAGFAAA